MTSEKHLRISLEPLVSGSPPLALAMQCWGETERAAQQQSLCELTASGSGGFLLLAAWRGERLVAALLTQQLPGRTATIWPAQVASEEDPAIAIPLLREAEVRLADAGVHLCQALLAKGQAEAALQLEQAGYQHPADLLYMTCEAGHFPAAPPAFSGFALETFKPGEEKSLAQLIDATYVGTQDCPTLNGMRDTLDVVEGYKSVGDFRPEHWLILNRQGTDAQHAGCLILAEHSTHKTMELIYVGVAPDFRKQGLGGRLTRQAQWLAAQAACERLVLAVDAANGPAISLYSAAGFWAWEERAIWVKRVAGPKPLG